MLGSVEGPLCLKSFDLLSKLGNILPPRTFQLSWEIYRFSDAISGCHVRLLHCIISRSSDKYHRFITHNLSLYAL